MEKDEKDEMAEELAHHKETLRVLRRRLRERELQEVKHGIDVPPAITSDLHDLTERIQRHEGEITRLQTLAAEDKEPLAEVEYRALIAKTWDTPEGIPTVAGAAQLEYERLRLGVKKERAHILERDMRTALAEETMSRISVVQVDDFIEEGIIPLFSYRLPEKWMDQPEIMRLLGRAIRLNPLVSKRLLLDKLVNEENIDPDDLFKSLLRAINVISSIRAISITDIDKFAVMEKNIGENAFLEDYHKINLGEEDLFFNFALDVANTHYARRSDNSQSFDLTDETTSE
jgi:hypothetical protein